jgi:hypothetical protein
VLYVVLFSLQKPLDTFERGEGKETDSVVSPPPPAAAPSPPSPFLFINEQAKTRQFMSAAVPRRTVKCGDAVIV